MIDLDPKDILQINATIIAGGLIFLTLIVGVLDIENSDPNYLVTGIMMLTMLIFLLSCFSAIRGHKTDAIRLMLFGFIVFIVFIIGIFATKAVIGLVKVTQVLQNYISNQSNSQQHFLNQNSTNNTKTNLTSSDVLGVLGLSLKGYQIE